MLQGQVAPASGEVVAEGIQAVEASSVPYHDLMTAGFPCQPFTATATGLCLSLSVSLSLSLSLCKCVCVCVCVCVSLPLAHTATATGAHEDEGEEVWIEQRPRGFRDPRGQLFWHMIRLIRYPKNKEEAPCVLVCLSLSLCLCVSLPL